MFLSKIKEYRVVKWATTTYVGVKANHPRVAAGCDASERFASSLFSVVSRVPGMHLADSLASSTLTIVETVAADINQRLARVVDATLSAAESLSEDYFPRLHKGMGMCSEVAQNVLEAALPDVNSEVVRVPHDEAPSGVLGALEKHSELVFELRRRIVGKDLSTLVSELFQCFIAFSQAVFFFMLSIPRRVIMWLLDVFKALFPKMHEKSANAATYAMQEMQDLGTRTSQAADRAREVVRRRVAAATGRTEDPAASTKTD